MLKATCMIVTFKAKKTVDQSNHFFLLRALFLWGRSQMLLAKVCYFLKFDFSYELGRLEAMSDIGEENGFEDSHSSALTDYDSPCSSKGMFCFDFRYLYLILYYIILSTAIFIFYVTLYFSCTLF